jgi:hypothetical protein
MRRHVFVALVSALSWVACSSGDPPCVGLSSPPTSRRARKPTNCSYVPLASPATQPADDRCTDLTTLPPIGSVTDEGMSFLEASGEDPPADVMVTEVIEPVTRDGRTLHQRWLFLTFSTSTDECAYRRAAALRRGVARSVVGVMQELDAPPTEALGPGTYAVIRSAILRPECDDPEVVAPGRLNANSTGTITITRRADGMVEGSYELTPKRGAFVEVLPFVSRGTFRAPVCAEPERPAVRCCG